MEEKKMAENLSKRIGRKNENCDYRRPIDQCTRERRNHHFPQNGAHFTSAPLLRE
jgi:hypothetical protein